MILDLNKIWKNQKVRIAVYFLSLISAVVTAKWESIITTFSKGAEVEVQQDFNSSLMTAFKTDSVVVAAFNNERFIELLFQSPLVTQRIEGFGDQFKDAVYNQIIKSDTNKISTRAYIAREANMSQDSVLYYQARILRLFVRNELATKKDVKTIAKETAIQVVGRRRSPGFTDNVH